eukprot:CAMPEP_0171999244 /NCGR_PEP_ID=MMETSP1041-20130122/1676_1 /TAXON_ID=464988 /ORGANISM="Hemiselmis andersenii, Strain CCMP439" /LENGTH=47 /DNA_ID= /DNA_START= /DNA_END= /DNA_ORIENTATION=
MLALLLKDVANAVVGRGQVRMVGGERFQLDLERRVVLLECLLMLALL